MRTEHKIIILSIVLALMAWIVDAVMDSSYSDEGTFREFLISEVSPREIFMRSAVVASVLLLGAVASGLLSRQRRAEEKRRESEERLSVVLRNSRDMAYRLDPKTGKFDYFSPSAIELTGFTPGELTLMGLEGITERIDPEDRDRFVAHFENVLKQTFEDGLAPTIEYRWKYQDGEYRWFSDNRVVVRDDDGNPVSVVGTIRDITYSKQAELALQESEARLQDMASGIPGVVFRFVHRTDGSVSLPLISDGVYELLGLTPEEIQADMSPLYSAVLPEDIQRVQQLIAEARESMSTWTAELGVKDKSGEMRWIRATANPHFLPDGSIAWNGVALDITERKKTEEALRESEERYRDLFENASDLIQSVAPDGRFIYVNRAWREALGYSKEEIAGLNLFDIIHPDSRAHCVKVFQRVMSGEEIDKVEAVFVAKDGTEIMVEGTANCKFVDGKPISTRGIFRDITERKRAGEALHLERDKLTRILDSMEDGVYIVSQEYDIEYVNPSLKKEFGSFAGLKCYEYLHGRKEVCPWCKNQDVFGGRTVHWELHFAKNQRTYDLVDTPLRNADGSISKLQILRDITERKKAEEALRESEEFSSNLLINSPNPMLVINEDSSVRYVNLALENLTGFSSAELIGRKAPYPWWTEETLQKTSGDLREAMRKGAKRLEELFQKKDGERFWVEITSVPVRSNGKFRYYLANWVDITERKRAEQALQESEEKYRLVSENIPVVVYSALPDEHSTNVLVTGRILELTGYPHQEFVEHAELWTQIIHPDDRDYVWKKIEEHREKMAPLDVEYRIITKSNTVKWIRDRATPMVDENGQLIRINGFMEDITERKKAEEAVEKVATEWESA